MTSTSPTPDISQLSISGQPAQQRQHDPYDYDGLSGAQRQPFHFSTSPVAPGQLPYNPLGGLNQSPLKNKSSRAGLPTVCTFLVYFRYTLKRGVYSFSLSLMASWSLIFFSSIAMVGESGIDE